MKYLHNIDSAETAGDSLGKINYNFLVADSLMCDLSSFYTKGDNNAYTILSEISSKVDNLNIVADYFDQPTKYKETYTAVSLLSSYWSVQQMTIQYPINFISDGYDSIKKYYIDNASTPDSILVNAGLNYLNINFPAYLYSNNTIMNVCFLIYSNDGAFAESIYIYPQTLPILINWAVTFTKADVYVKKSKTIRFKKMSNNTWLFFQTVG